MKQDTHILKDKIVHKTYYIIVSQTSEKHQILILLVKIYLMNIRKSKKKQKNKKNCEKPLTIGLDLSIIRVQEQRDNLEFKLNQRSS